MQVKKYPAQGATGDPAPAPQWCSTSLGPPPDGGLVLALVLLVILIWKRRKEADVDALRDSHASVWQRMILLAQRLDDLEHCAASDDGSDFTYSKSATEASHG